MRQQRWFPIAALAVGLFVVNAVVRLITRFVFDGDDTVTGRASVVMFALIGLIIAGYAFVVSQRRPPVEWLLPDLVLGALGGMLLTILIGPFLSGGQPFSGGSGYFFSQIWLYGGFAIGGTLVGYWVAVMLACDYRSRALAAYTERKQTKVRKVVRR